MTFASDATGTISGVAYQDLNRNQIQESGESPWANHELYLFNATTGAYIARAVTNPNGSYTFADLPLRDYKVQYSSPTWWTVRNDWVPTTTNGTLKPEINVMASSAGATANFGWRQIVRSTDINAPITGYIGPSGLRVYSYDDVVAARELHDAIAQGLIGAEAPYVKVRFDYGNGSWTGASTANADGVYTSYSAVSDVDYQSWLTEGPNILSHEYGHAWSLYYAYMVQQDPTLKNYLKARGLENEPRVNSNYAWSRGELIAEDYRQLLGPASVRGFDQINTQIPRAADVPGLEIYLKDVFTVPPGGTAPSPPVVSLKITNLAISPNPLPLAGKTNGTISFNLSLSSKITVDILNSQGGLVRSLLNNTSKTAGPISLVWDRKDVNGRRIKAGTYTVKVQTTASNGDKTTATFEFRTK